MGSSVLIRRWVFKVCPRAFSEHFTEQYFLVDDSSGGMILLQRMQYRTLRDFSAIRVSLSRAFRAKTLQAREQYSPFLIIGV